MNKSKAIVVAAGIVVGIAAGVAAQKRDKAPGPLVIKSQGSFFVGGETKDDHAARLRAERRRPPATSPSTRCTCSIRFRRTAISTSPS